MLVQSSQILATRDESGIILRPLCMGLPTRANTDLHRQKSPSLMGKAARGACVPSRSWTEACHHGPLAHE